MFGLFLNSSFQAPLQPMPANVAAALATFNGIYDSYLRLTAMDVWTGMCVFAFYHFYCETLCINGQLRITHFLGRSNDIVNRWSSFCSTQAPIISAATSMRLVPYATLFLHRSDHTVML